MQKFSNRHPSTGSHQQLQLSCPNHRNAGNEMTHAELGLLLLREQSPEMTQQPTASDLITQFQNDLRRMYGQQSQNQQLVQVGYTPNSPAAQYPMPNIQSTDGHSKTSNTRTVSTTVLVGISTTPIGGSTILSSTSKPTTEYQ